MVSKFWLLSPKKGYPPKLRFSLYHVFGRACTALNERVQDPIKQLIQGGYLSDSGSGGRQQHKVLGSPIQRREASEVTIDKNPPRYATYGMNWVLNGVGRNRPISTGQLTVHRLLAPGRTLYISEGNLAPGTQRFGVSVSPWSPPNNTDGIGTFVYADGHIGQMPIEEFPAEKGEKYSESWYLWQGYDK